MRHLSRRLVDLAVSVSARLVGLAALAVLLFAFVAVPVVVFAVTGMPDRRVLGELSTGRLDEQVVIHLGGLCFVVLWAWFAIVALGETAAVLRWWWIGRGRTGTGADAAHRLDELEPIGSGAAGRVRRLVRIALLSGLGLGAAAVVVDDPADAAGPAEILHAWPAADAAGTADASSCRVVEEIVTGGGSAGTGPVGPGPGARALEAPDTVSPDTVSPDTVTQIVSDGRMTPYSVAAVLGDPALRETVVEMNRGARTPAGGTWLGGVFPAGMAIEVPSASELALRPKWRAHVVAPGETVYGIAVELAGADRSQVTVLVDRIVERNQGRQLPDGTIFEAGSVVSPGWVIDVPELPRAEPPAPSAELGRTIDPDDGPDDRPPTGVAAALLLCAGAIGAVDTRRRRLLRRIGPADVEPAPPPPAERSAEVELRRSGDAIGAVEALGAALRVVAETVANTSRVVLGAFVDRGVVTVVFDDAVDVGPPDGFVAVAPDRWAVDVDRPWGDARSLARPCPALVHVGTANDCRTGASCGELFVDVEAFGAVAVDAASRPAGELVSFLALSMLLSPLAPAARFVLHGVDMPVPLDHRRVERSADLDSAIDRAALALGRAALPAPGDSTFRRRARSSLEPEFGPVVLVTSGEVQAGPEGDAVLDDLASICRGGGRGLAVLVARPLAGAGATLRAVGHPDDPRYAIDRLGVVVRPPAVAPHELDDVVRLVDARPAPRLVIGTADGPRRPSAEPADDWSLMVRLLGPVSVLDRDGATVPFERRRTLELLAWLVEHRESATRGAARAALWEHAVSDATFANVVSDLRRSLNRAMPLGDGDEWVARDRHESLVLHRSVVSDAELLRHGLAAARTATSEQAVTILRPVVELVTDLPFAGTRYSWPDPEGITSSLVVLATTAAAVLAQHCLALGDTAGVFDATGRGMRVLPGHDELVALRLRAHAERGDRAALRYEWELYERTLRADPWGPGEVSAKLASLRDGLLAS